MRLVVVFLLTLLIAAGGFWGYPYVVGAMGSPAVEVDDESAEEEVESVSDPVAEEAPSLETMSAAVKELIDISVGDTTADSDKVADLFARIVQTHIAITKNSATSHEAEQSHFNLLYGAYAAVKIDPDRYRNHFDGLTSQIVADDPKSKLASNASLLRILAKHDLSQPATTDLFQDLNHFVVRYSPELGARLFSTLSRELFSNNQKPSAELVLQHGIKTYRSRPESELLSDQLTSLGFAPPKQPVAQKRSASSNRIQWDPVVLPLPAHLRSKAYQAPGFDRSSVKKCAPKKGRS